MKLKKYKLKIAIKIREILKSRKKKVLNRMILILHRLPLHHLPLPHLLLLTRNLNQHQENIGKNDNIYNFHFIIINEKIEDTYSPHLLFPIPS